MKDIILCNENHTLFVKVLLAFYIIIGSSLLQPLLAKQWRNFVENDRLIQHAIGITTMIAIVTFVYEGRSDYSEILMYSFIGYLWFIFSTKLDIHWNIMIMILLLAVYLYGNNIQIKNNTTDNDKILTEDEKKKIINKNNTQGLISFVGVLMFTLCGVMLYSDKKEVQYGGGYDLVNFLLY